MTSHLLLNKRCHSLAQTRSNDGVFAPVMSHQSEVIIGILMIVNTMGPLVTFAKKNLQVSTLKALGHFDDVADMVFDANVHSKLPVADVKRLWIALS